MATVNSYTAAKILELASQWEGVSLSQEEINALLAQLQTDLDSLNVLIDTLNNATLPQLQEDLANNDVALANLNDNVLPGLNNDLAVMEGDITDLQTVTLPAIQQSLNNEIEGNAARPIVYTQPDEPTNPDINDRDLIVGDVWFDNDDAMTQRLWNGTEWSLMDVDVSQIVDVVEQYISPLHQLYSTPAGVPVAVTNGPNITPTP